MAETMKWFGVKALYRWSIGTSPNHAQPDRDLVEERVLLVRARTSQKAIETAEKNAAEYSATTARNPFGQEIKGRYLGACDCFQLFDAPADLTEVFSATELIKKGRSDRHVVDARLGRQWPDERRLRAFFADGEFSRVV